MLHNFVGPGECVKYSGDLSVLLSFLTLLTLRLTKVMQQYYWHTLLLVCESTHSQAVMHRPLTVKLKKYENIEQLLVENGHACS